VTRARERLRAWGIYLHSFPLLSYPLSTVSDTQVHVRAYATKQRVVVINSRNVEFGVVVAHDLPFALEGS
jgi:hypothetical protein